MDHSSNKRPDFGKLPVENLSNLHESFKEILRDLNSHENYLPEKLVKNILKEVGFESCDQNTYKLISLLADKLLNDIIHSISLVKKRPNKPINPNEMPVEDPKVPGLAPKSKPIKKSKDVVPKNFQLKNLLAEFEERGINVFRSPYYPHSDLVNNFIANLEKKPTNKKQGFK